MKKQARFANKHGFSYPVLSDPDHAISEAYGVWKEKSFMGRKYMGIDRVTFVIDKPGILRHVFPKVNVLGHAKQVLEALESIG